MVFITQTHLLIALLSTAILILFHYLSPMFALKFSPDSKVYASFAGGTAVAYVFLHMLPNLVEYNEPIGKLLISSQWLTPFAELLIYIIALLGFVIYFGLELLAESKTNKNRFLVYQLHLGMFVLYNFLITYTMALRAQESITATLIFTFSMALHFIITDRKFSRLYSMQFNHSGRFVLICGLFSGWICSVVFDPVNVVIASFMIAFLAGSVLLNVFREELPSAKLMNYFWFVGGISVISIIFVIQTLFRTHQL